MPDPWIITGSITLGDSVRVPGDLYLNSGTLALNGHRISVEGSVIQSGGLMDIGAGRLEVAGDYRIQKETVNPDGTVAYGRSTGILNMVNAAGYVQVGGTFAIQSDRSHNSHLTAGTMEVKGDFIQRNGSYLAYWGEWLDLTNNFVATGTHKVVLSADSLQTLDFQSLRPPNNAQDLPKFVAGTAYEQVKTVRAVLAPDDKREILPRTVMLVRMIGPSRSTRLHGIIPIEFDVNGLRTFKGVSHLREDLPLIRERLEGFARYNAWEKEQARNSPPVDLAARLAWLDEAYELARSLGALRPLPTDTSGWLAEVQGIGLMRERLALLGDRHE